jgi:hypothetical protein
VIHDPACCQVYYLRSVVPRGCDENRFAFYVDPEVMDPALDAA